MRTISMLSLLVAVVVLASCASTGTTLVSRQRLDKDLAGKLAYEHVAVTTSVRQFTQGDLDQLRGAVLARLQQPTEGGVPVTLQLEVTDFGAAGSKLIVRARVLNAAGKLYAEFDVYQNAYTLMGAFDRRSSAINAIADAVARALMAIHTAPQETMDARNFGS